MAKRAAAVPVLSASSPSATSSPARRQRVAPSNAASALTAVLPTQMLCEALSFLTPFEIMHGPAASDQTLAQVVDGGWKDPGFDCGSGGRSGGGGNGAGGGGGSGGGGCDGKLGTLWTAQLKRAVRSAKLKLPRNLPSEEALLRRCGDVGGRTSRSSKVRVTSSHPT
jgi:hypothetical protein